MQRTTSHTTRRILATLALGTLAAVTTLVVPAAAQEYPPTPIVVPDGDGTVPEGGSITINGSGYLPNSVICICILNGPPGFAETAGLASVAAVAQTQAEQAVAACLAAGGTVIGTTTSDANGNWSFIWDTSEFPPGEYELLATDGTNFQSTTITVTPPGSPSTTVPSGQGGGAGRLPQTGGMADGPLRVGAVLLAVGGLVLLAVRNRRPTDHART